MKTPKHLITFLLFFCCCLAGLNGALAQGTAFTYQGRLNDGANPANGNYDLRFAIYDTAGGGAQQGGLLTNSATAVSNGLFTVTLDFGNQFSGADRWLELAVRTNGAGAFTLLAPRQPLTASPYAVEAVHANSAKVVSAAGIIPGTANISIFGNAGTATFSTNAAAASTAGLATNALFAGTATNALNFTGAVLDTQLSTNIVRRNGSNTFNGVLIATNPANQIVGTFTGNGAALANLNASQLAVGTVPLALLPGIVLTNGAGNVNLSGTFAGDGFGMMNLNLRNADSSGAISFATNFPGNFVVVASPTVGNAPTSLAAADVNADSYLDLISASGNQGTLSILTNNSKGMFVLATTPNPGVALFSLVAADFNGDGRADVAGADSIGDKLMVLTNNGAGGFVPAASPGVGKTPVFIAAADINDDGKVDLVSANININTLTVMTNSGVSFGSNATVQVGARPLALAVADFNGDSKPDLACANTADDTLSVLTNNGTGRFVFASSSAAGVGPRAVVAGDINGDGKPDLICANYDIIHGTGNTLTLLTNRGSGFFDFASTLTVGDSPRFLVATDVNGDSKLDLVCANQLSSNNVSSLTVLTNSGNGNFGIASSPLVGGGPVWLATGDFNSDGQVDLASANGAADSVTVLLNALVFPASFSGNGAGLTNVNAATAVYAGTATNAFSAESATTAGLATNALFAQIATNALNYAGAVLDSQLSANIARLDGTNLFIATNRFFGVFIATNPANQIAGTFTGNGAGVTNVSAVSALIANSASTVPAGGIGAGTANISISGNAATATSATIATVAGLATNALFAGLATNALNYAGAVSDSQLSTNVVWLGGTNLFTATNRFFGVVIATNPANQIAGAFTGNGGGLTNVSAASLTGTLTASAIAVGSISATMLANGAVGSNQLAANAVTTAALANGAVTAAKVATVSNWFALTIANPTPEANDNFGFAIAALGSDRVLVGANGDNVEAGAAYLFSANGALLATFMKPSPAVGDFFGAAVAAVGNDRVLVGAYLDDTGATDAGAAYLFNTNGALVTTFTNPAPAAFNNFGIAVAAVGNDRVMIGAPFNDTGATDAGAAYLFSTNGALLTTFTNPAPAVSDRFGNAIAAVGSTLVLIAASFDDVGATNAGAAYLFNTNGTLLTTFTNPTPALGDLFGNAVAALGSDRVLVGAQRDDLSGTNVGTAYLFSTNGTLLTTFTNPTPSAFENFGSAVAAVGSDRVLVGALADDTGADGAGAAYLFKTNGTLLTTFANPTPATFDNFGSAVAALGSDRVLVGANFDNTGADAAGAAYLFSTEIFNDDLAADSVRARSIVTASLEDGAVTVAKLDSTIGVWTRGIGDTIYRNSGNVGIGKTAPATALDVNGTIMATNFVGNGSGLTNVYTAGAALTLVGNQFNVVLGTSGISTSVARADHTHSAAQVTTGTFSDGLLSANVALLNRANQTFTGTNSFSNRVGIGTASPATDLDVNGNLTVRGLVAPATAVATNILNLGSGSTTNPFANGISFFEGSTSPSMSFGYDGTRSGSDNALRIYNSTGSNVFAFEHGGFLGLGVVNPANPVQHSSGAVLTTGGAWVNASDRNAKENFTPVNVQEILSLVAALPLTRWNYKVEGANIQHVGPMAQDFRAAFALGQNDKSIATVDADGVALAAIQGLNQKLEQKETEITELKARNASLEARLDRLERLSAQTAK